jgi:hypothetical protein
MYPFGPIGLLKLDHIIVVQIKYLKTIINDKLRIGRYISIQIDMNVTIFLNSLIILNLIFKKFLFIKMLTFVFLNDQTFIL